jgi:hypothetical protein
LWKSFRHAHLGRGRRLRPPLCPRENGFEVVLESVKTLTLRLELAFDSTQRPKHLADLRIQVLVLCAHHIDR